MSETCRFDGKKKKFPTVLVTFHLKKNSCILITLLSFKNRIYYIFLSHFTSAFGGLKGVDGQQAARKEYKTLSSHGAGREIQRRSQVRNSARSLTASVWPRKGRGSGLSCSVVMEQLFTTAAPPSSSHYLPSFGTCGHFLHIWDWQHHMILCATCSILH